MRDVKRRTLLSPDVSTIQACLRGFCATRCIAMMRHVSREELGKRMRKGFSQTVGPVELSHSTAACSSTGKSRPDKDFKLKVRNNGIVGRYAYCMQVYPIELSGFLVPGSCSLGPRENSVGIRTT